MKNWLVASYKKNQVKRLQINLADQKFDYYLPKITTKKLNSKPKEELLFPGYIFVNINIKNYSALRYTKGIKNIIKFGDSISYIADEEIELIKKTENKSKINPLISKIKIGQEATISSGSLKGSIVKICSMPAKERVGVLLSFLGSVRRIIIPTKNLTL